MYLDTVNEIVISGRIISKFVNKAGEKCFTLISKNGENIFPKIIYEESMLPDLGEHARVNVRGHMEIRDIYVGHNKKVFKQVIVADSIQKEKTLVEEKFGVPGKFFSMPSCVIYLKGIVQSVKKEDDWYRIILSVNNPHDKSVSYSIRISMREVDRQPDIKEGSLIYTVCKMTTPKKETSEGTKHYEDIMVNDIAVVND